MPGDEKSRVLAEKAAVGAGKPTGTHPEKGAGEPAQAAATNMTDELSLDQGGH